MFKIVETIGKNEKYHRLIDSSILSIIIHYGELDLYFTNTTIEFSNKYDPPLSDLDIRIPQTIHDRIRSLFDYNSFRGIANPPVM